jgi:hypothetical protein
MELQKLKQDFTICKVNKIERIDFGQDFLFLAKTDDEISLVCESSAVPKDVLVAEVGWKALKIVGVLDFSMVGVLAKISGVLAVAGISIFAVSTYNTDYVLMKDECFEKGIQVLVDSGYTVK